MRVELMISVELMQENRVQLQSRETKKKRAVTISYRAMNLHRHPAALERLFIPSADDFKTIQKKLVMSLSNKFCLTFSWCQ
jgi:hypothetical protein